MPRKVRESILSHLQVMSCAFNAIAVLIPNTALWGPVRQHVNPLGRVVPTLARRSLADLVTWLLESRVLYV